MLLGAGAIVGASVAGAAAGLASVPHCAAMCGPLAAYACRGGGGARHGAYLAGRALGYGLAGFAAGTAGAAITDLFRAPVAQAALSWILALGLGLAAWRLWRASAPRPAKGLVTLGRSSPRRAPVPAALLGLATTLLPCGALLAALLIAAGTGSGAAGSAAMLAFAGVSSLGLLGAALLGARLRSLGRQRLEARRVLAVALALGALVLALRPADALRGQPDTCHGTGLSHAAELMTVPGASG